MYDIDRIRQEVREVCAEAGCPISIPINLNNRFTRTLGRVMYRNNDPTCMEFSTQFITTSTDEAVRQVILHETAHYIAVIRSGERHGHDAYFKEICAEIGCTNDKTSYDAERIVSKDKLYKYAVYCPNCGCIGGYRKWTGKLERLPYCSCKRCGSQELSYVTNW